MGTEAQTVRSKSPKESAFSSKGTYGPTRFWSLSSCLYLLLCPLFVFFFFFVATGLGTAIYFLFFVFLFFVCFNSTFLR